MKIQLFMILLIIKTFLLSQNGVEAGPSECSTDAECPLGKSCRYLPAFKVNKCL